VRKFAFHEHSVSIALLAYLLAIQFGVGEQGVYVSIVLGESLAGLVAIALFRRGRRKLKQV